MAILWAAFVPSLSHAMAAAGSLGAVSWSEVCGAQGSRWVQLDMQDEAQKVSREAAALQAMAHCECCLSQTPMLGLLPQHDSALLQGLRDAVPRLFLLASRPQFAWASAQPRAPPQSA